MPTIRLLIKGKVQGVFYRAAAKDVADEIGLTGWVRNTEEGNVECVTSGSEEQLQRFIEWCKVGTRRAVVTDVIVTYEREESFGTFKIIR
jgi:acylphosphatase